jgi:hypothetical protein
VGNLARGRVALVEIPRVRVGTTTRKR